MKAALRYAAVRFGAEKAPRGRGILVPWQVVLVLLALFPAGCGGGSDDGANPNTPPKPLVVGSGNFNVATWITFNGCELTKTFSESYWIEIDETGFAMGDWSGTWSAESNSLTATGESEHETVTLRDCAITTWTTVVLDFTSENEFTGHVTFRRRAVGGTCECATCTACQSAWGISGVRSAEPGALEASPRP